jgi:hypothetical protein
MKRIVLSSILVTSALATDGSIYIAEAETKGPGRKSKILYNEFCSPPPPTSYLFNYELTALSEGVIRQGALPSTSEPIFILQTQVNVKLSLYSIS